MNPFSSEEKGTKGMRFLEESILRFE